MSFHASRWAWAQPLSPSAKLLLLALADHANGEGVCWPAQERLAMLCGISGRQVRNLLRELAALSLLSIEHRPGDGAGRRSNIYRLAPGGGLRHEASGSPFPFGEEARGTPFPVAGGATGSPLPGASGTPLPSNHHSEPVSLSPLPTRGESEKRVSSGDLVFPKTLTEAEQEQAAYLVAQAPDQAQALLDELAGLMAANRIKVGPLALLRGLVSRAAAGTFCPECGLKVRQQREAARQRPEAAAPAVDHRAVLRGHARLLGVDEEEYLARMGAKA